MQGGFQEGLLHPQKLLGRANGVNGHGRCDTPIAKFYPSRPVLVQGACVPATIFTLQVQ